MSDIGVRMLLVVPVATLLPLGLPTLPRPSRRATIAGAIVLLALTPFLGRWQPWAIAAVAASAAAVPIADRHRPWAVLGATAIVCAVAALATDGQRALDGVAALVRDDRVTVVAALVIAGKAVARFPAFREERFAEYYVIGSLMSLAVAFGAALAVRAMIGADPVAPI